MIPGNRDDDDEEGNNARVTYRADADTRSAYYIAVGAFGDYEGTYTLVVDY